MVLQEIANFLNGVVGGAIITQVRDFIYLVYVVVARRPLTVIRWICADAAVGLANGRIVPLLPRAHQL